MGMKKSIAKDIFLKLKPGDKLLVNKDLQYIEDTYGVPYGVVDDMEKFEGKVVTVSELHNSPDESEGPFVFIKEDWGQYSWAPECFECKVITSPKDEPLGLSWKKMPKPKKEKDIPPPEDTAKLNTYDFSYSPDGKVVCRNLATKETAIARCHEEDVFSLEVGELVAFAHMLGYDVDHCGSNDRFTLIKKKPAYYYGEKVLVDTSHPDCPKAMKENYKDEIGIILSYSLDRKANTYIYKVVFKDEKIYKLQENVLKNVPINFIPGAQDPKDTYVKVKKK